MELEGRVVPPSPCFHFATATKKQGIDMSVPYLDKKPRRRRRNRPANVATTTATATATTTTPSTLPPPSPAASTAAAPFSIIVQSIVRYLAVSIVLAHCTFLLVWFAASSLCLGENAPPQSEGSAICPHTFYAETGGQCVALVDATTASIGGSSAAAYSIRTDDYSSGVLCHDAEVLLTLAQKYSPFWPLALPARREDASSASCCDLLIENDRKYAGDGTAKPHPIEGIFGHYRSERKRKRETKIPSASIDNDTIMLRRVVSKHRANPSNVDRRHPLRRLVESAAAVFGRKKATAKNGEKRSDGEVLTTSSPPKAATVSTDWARDASSSPALHLDFEKKELVKMIADGVREGISIQSNGKDTATEVEDFDERVANVGWGGPIASGGRPWWLPESSTKTEMDGERLAAAYAKIMGWPSPGEYTTKFPFKKCQEGCDPHFAFLHTLEWREKFKPWCITPSAVKENRDSFFYVRGHSPPNPNIKDGDATIGHSLVFYRPGLHKYEDTESYLRLIMHTLDAAVADSYSRSNNRVGKFNIILDCNGFSLSILPGFSEVKRLFTMMQDHFPDRLGVLMIVNLSGPGQLFLKMIKGIISEAVKKKIHIVPPTDKGGMEMLKVLVEEEFIPTWLGGTDDFVLNPKVAYPENRMCTEAEGREYYQTMPFHAP